VHRLDQVEGHADLLALYAGVQRSAPDDQPWVLANMVCGIDGSTAIAGRVGALSTPAHAAFSKRNFSRPDDGRRATMTGMVIPTFSGSHPFGPQWNA
jgi:hypothetical protein